MYWYLAVQVVSQFPCCVQSLYLLSTYTNPDPSCQPVCTSTVHVLTLPPFVHQSVPPHYMN